MPSLCGGGVPKQKTILPLIGPDESAKGRTIHWIELIPYIGRGIPKHQGKTSPQGPAMHLRSPSVHHSLSGELPPISTKKGLVAQINHRCIGCRYCTTACPYTVKYFNWFVPQWPEEMKEGLSIETSPSGQKA